MSPRPRDPTSPLDPPDPPNPPDPKPGADDERARAIRLLEGVMQAEGVRPEEIDRRVGSAAGTTAAVLAGAEPEPAAEGGRAELLAILDALELEPEVFFGALHPPSLDERGAGGPPRAVLFDRLAAELALAGYGPHPAGGREETEAARDPEELERRVREAIRGALAGEGSGPAEPEGPRRRRG